MLQNDDGVLVATYSLVSCCCLLIVIIPIIAGFWKTFEKAGKPGWAAIIPFYNIWILLEIVGRPGWWLILYFIPVVNFFIQLIVAIDAGKSFGKDTIYSVILLWFLTPIGFLILGFGDAEYQGPSVA
jgi:hypothetical protein